MNLSKRFLLLFFVFFSISAFAKTNLSFSFPGAKGKQVLLWAYDDLISYREKILAKSSVDSKNNFSFSIDNKEVMYIRVQVDFIRFDFYVEPNQNYQIVVDSVDFSNRLLYPIEVVGYLKPNFSILSPNKNELNSELNLVNQAFAQFYDSNYVFLYQSRLPDSTLRSFEKSIVNLKEQINSNFVKKHIDIQLVQLKLVTRQTGSKHIVDSYFTPKMVNYNNKIYMDYFNSFWSKYILFGMSGLRFGELDSVVNLGSYNALVRLLERDPLLKNPQIREMVVLRNIIQMYSDYRFKEDALGDILMDIVNHGLTPENKRIALNIRLQMLDFIDNKAPDFELPSFANQMVKLSDFEGKYVYINFWNEQCKKCVAEMDITRELFLDYDDIIQFVSIYIGPNADIAKDLIADRGYKWLQLDYNQDFSLIKNYKVELFPLYVLIDKNGRILWQPSVSPSDGFSSAFVKMLNDKKANLK